MKQEPKAPLVYPVPPRLGIWTGSNQLGNEVPFETNALNRQKVIHLPEWGPPVRWTINLGIDHTAAIAGAFEATAEIEYGVGGVRQQILVNWIEGTTITVNANSIDVVAIWTGFPPVSDPTLKLRATLSRGSSNYPTNAVYCADLSVATVTLSAFSSIPKMARRLRVLSKTDPDRCYNVLSFLKLSGDQVGLTKNTFLHGDVLKAAIGTGIPIPWFAKFFAFQNNDANTADFTVVFDIEP